jgi:cytochrome b561
MVDQSGIEPGFGRRFHPLGDGSGPGPAASGAARSGPLRRQAGPPRSDTGTIVLHWTMTIAMLVSLFTGLRISADAENSVFAKSLNAILPQGEIWTPHILSALTVIVCSFAYAIYLSRSGLGRRVSLKKTRVFGLEAAPKLYWGAVNVILHWILFAAVVTLLGSGVALYLGYGGPVVTIHYTACLVVLGYIVAHVFAHTMYGGLGQLLRLFRPAPIAKTAALKERPLAIAALVGVVVAGGAAALDHATGETVTSVRIAANEAPDREKLLEDPVWRRTRPVFVKTMQGANLGGTGTSMVEIRSVHDDARIWFAFRWEDPTRSIKRIPLVKHADGWHMMHNKADIADETAHYEDKFAVLFSKSAGFGSGGTTHLGPNPLPGLPSALNKRGSHYTTDGSLADMWQWKASRGGLLSYMDDMWFSTPVAPNADQIAGKTRYQAGYDGDKGRAFYVYNFVVEPPGGFRGPIQVKRLPIDWKKTTAKLGKVDFADDASDDEGSQWWMFEDESVPYSKELDDQIPVGTVIPAVLIMGKYEGSRADVRASARWRDGHWTLVATRALDTHDAQDLPMESGLSMWVSVFDHTQTRHTRHMRPVTLEMR